LACEPSLPTFFRRTWQGFHGVAMTKRFISFHWMLAVLLAAGALLPLRVNAQPSMAGQWSGVLAWPISATHTHLLPTGKVMFFGEFDEGEEAWLWDPTSGAPTRLTPPGYNIFCAGHSFLGDGRLLVTGGHIESHEGLPDTSLFDPFTLSWIRAPDMNAGRWYPTNTTLPNGDALVFSGEIAGSGDINELVQRFNQDSRTWTDLTNSPQDLPYYPRMFLTRYGKIFFAGPSRFTRFIDPNGLGSWYFGPASKYGSRTYGPAVYVDGKVFLIGGGDPPTPTVEMADLHATMPVWNDVASMTASRRQLNATLLPDGTVLVTGGSSGSGFDNDDAPVLHAEVYDPATNRWTRLASQSIYRGYHSTALLLPDGRVLSAGGRRERTAEIFSPPYLFKGPRPTVTSVPGVVTPGTTFFVQTPDADAVTKVTLIAPGSVTHAFDEHQRLLTLRFSKSPGGLTIEAPESNTLAPVGYHQLFLVNGAGVPSVGRMVRIGAETNPRIPVIVFGDVWKYDDSRVDRGTAWLGLNYDDSTWASGRGQLGYGEEDEATVLRRTSPSQPTVYFRKKFTLDRTLSRAHLEMLHDDGVAVWINGVLVFSKYVDDGLEFAKYASFTSDNEYSRASLAVTPGLFRVGENIIAVAVKQAGSTSSDLSFALALEVEHGTTEPPPDTLRVLAPNGGEVFLAGSSTLIRWSSTGSISAVNLDYSPDLGATWTPIAIGVANTGSYSWTVPEVATNKALVRVSRTGGAPPSDVSDAPFTITRETRSKVIVFGDVWKYHDSGTDPGAAWNTPGYGDSAWASGPGELGYGDGDEATVLRKTSPAQTSVYFRRKISLSGPVISADLRIRYDDGIAVWVNGTRVFTRNMDRGLEHTRYASASAENAEATATLPIAPFVTGENIIAVMVKQVGGTSPDFSFNLELELGLSR
jgi:galactose oxidase